MDKIGRFIYSGSKDCADLLFLSGFLAEDPFLWFSVGDENYIIVSAMELERARKQCRKGVTPLTADQAARKWKLGDAKKKLSNILAAVARAENVWKSKITLGTVAYLADGS